MASRAIGGKDQEKPTRSVKIGVLESCMQLNDYQKEALKTVAITEHSVAALAHRSLGLAGEAGTLANAVKKVIRDRDGQTNEADTNLAREKLGDVLYYTAVLAEYYGLSLEEIAQANMEKSAEFLRTRDKN